MFAALEARRQRELVAQAGTLAENPTLKRRSTPIRRKRDRNSAVKAQLLATIDSELRKVAAGRGRRHRPRRHASEHAGGAGRLGDRWPRGQPVRWPRPGRRLVRRHCAHEQRDVRVVAVPLDFSDGTTVGMLYLATSLDANYAQELAQLAGTRTAIISDGLLLASTLAPEAAREFEAAVAATRPAEGTMSLAGESHAYRRLVAVATRCSTRWGRSTNHR